MKSTLKTMVLSLTIIACAMGAVLAGVHMLTAEPIAQAEASAKQEALAQVLPAFDNDPEADSYEYTVEGDKRPVRVYPATKDGAPVGYAVESWTSDGFSGDIIVMAGFDANGAVTGYQVLSHAETPGLGAKADEWFKMPVNHRSILGTTTPLIVSKDADSSADDSPEANTTGATAKADKAATPIDGITAATITSRAFLDAINRARKAAFTDK